MFYINDGDYEGGSLEKLANEVANYHVDADLGEPWIEEVVCTIQDKEVFFPDAALFAFREMVQDKFDDRIGNGHCPALCDIDNMDLSKGVA